MNKEYNLPLGIHKAIFNKWFQRLNRNICYSTKENLLLDDSTKNIASIGFDDEYSDDERDAFLNRRMLEIKSKKSRTTVRLFIPTKRKQKKILRKCRSKKSVYQ